LETAEKTGLLFVDSVLLASSEQGIKHALDQFAAACDQAVIRGYDHKLMNK